MCKYIINTDTVITDSKERVFPKKYMDERNRYWDSYTKTFRIVGKRMENFETFSLDILDVLNDGKTVSSIGLSKILFSDVIYTRFCSAKNIVDNYGDGSLVHPCYLEVVLSNPKTGEYFLGEEKARSLLESETQYTLISTPVIYKNNLGISSLEEAARVLLTKEVDLDLKLNVETLINYNNSYHFISTAATELTSADLDKLNKHTSFLSFIGWKAESANNGKATSNAMEILKRFL